MTFIETPRITDNVILGSVQKRPHLQQMEEKADLIFLYELI